jgi:hypothetical protein
MKWTITNSLQSFMIIVGVVLAILLYLDKCSGTRNKVDELNSVIAALNDSVRYYKNQDSNNVATIRTIQTEKTKTFLQLQTKDREVQELQATVKEYKSKLVAGSSVTNALLETLSKTTSPTIITKTDTVRGNDSVVYLYPTYKDTAKAKDKKWIDYTVIANKDSITLDLDIKNKFSVIVGEEKGKPFADVVTENPFTKVKTLRTYQVTVPKPKRIGIGPSFGYGFSDSFKRQFFLGVSIHYDILRL